MSGSLLLVGIGSPHGDDRVGWEVARRTGECSGAAAVARSARKPVDLLDWLAGVDVLEICDAVAVDAAIGSIHSWQWPAREIASTPFRCTHDLSLPAVLALAESLGRLPPRVRIWGVAIRLPITGDALSPEVAAAVPALVNQICDALVQA